MIRRRGALTLIVLIGLGCGGPAPRDLSELVVRDSTYLDPVSLEPYSGPVFRTFADAPADIQIEGSLYQGSWDGEFRAYHPNGRIRYMGNFVRGRQCGAWTENADSVPTGSLYEEVVREVETMGLYPPCEPES